MELFKPDFGLIFWMFVAFAILFFVLWKWGWPAIMKLLVRICLILTTRAKRDIFLM